MNRVRLATLPIGIFLGAHEMHVMSPASEEHNQRHEDKRENY